MSAIGPGSIVQAVRDGVVWSHPRRRINAGALYRVAEVADIENGPCTMCGGATASISLVGEHPLIAWDGCWCPCDFRPWPPEPPAELRCEPVDQDEPVLA